MTLYRKFGQGLAILCCITMFVMTAVLIISGGISNQDADTKELIYFYERADVQAAAFVAISFLISAVANALTVSSATGSLGCVLFHSFISHQAIKLLATWINASRSRTAARM